MFSGIVEELGVVQEVGDHRLVVTCRTAAAGTDVGGSVAVNGACLTVVERGSECLAFDLSEETLARTSLSRLRPGDGLNLERPVTLATRLGGHLVQGHVDGVARVVEVSTAEGGVDLVVRLPAGLERYVVEKGSVTIDGVSLTVAETRGDTVRIALIPYTLEATTLGGAAVKDPVNIEVDLIAKYVERLAKGDP